jgi:nucleoid-associated protein YgaU
MQTARTLWRHGVQKDSKSRYHTDSPSQRHTVTHSADVPQKHDLAYVPDLSKLVGGAGLGYAVAAAYRKNLAAGLSKPTGSSAMKTDLSTTDVVRHFSMDSCFTA